MVSVTGTIQPGTLQRALTPENLEAGLPARLLMAMPPPQRKQWSKAVVAPEVRNAFKQLLERLLDLDFDPNAEGSQPHALLLDDEAQASWARFYNEWAGEQINADGPMQAALAKFEGAAARLALVHHVAGQVARNQSDLVPVGLESVEAGITLCRWFAAEARRLYALLAQPAAAKKPWSLEEYIQKRGGGIRAAELQSLQKERYPTAELADAALQGLVDAGKATWEQIPATSKGGRPTRRLQMIHPSQGNSSR